MIVEIFTSKNCPPCKQLKENVKQALMRKQFDVIVWDYDQSPDKFREAGIEKTPTIRIYAGSIMARGELVHECQFAMAASQIIKVLEDNDGRDYR